MSIAKKLIKYLLVVVGIIILSLVYFWDHPVFIFARSFYWTYTKQDLIQNYKAKQAELEELKRHIKTIVPPDMAIFIEFEGRNSLAIFHLTSYSATGKNHDENWNLAINAEKTTFLLKQLGWTIETLNSLKTKLDRANCISIASDSKTDSPVSIGYQRSGWGKYSYLLFHQPLTEKQKKDYIDGCAAIYFQEKVVLEYGGGAVGPQCFPDK